MTLRCAIVGGGWAGMAAAWSLRAQPGVHITVFESAHRLGGRARSAPSPTGFSAPLDNGQHLLLGAYRDTLRIIESLHADLDSVLLRLPLQLQTLSGDRALHMHPHWPAPFHALAALFEARGWTWSEKLGLVKALMGLRLRGFRLEQASTVEQWLRQARQPKALIDSFWSPLCLAALNTPIERACASTFARTLKDSLLGTRADSDMILPRIDLGELWVEPLARQLEARGHTIHRGHAVRHLDPVESCVKVDGETFDAAILALPPWSWPKLKISDPELETWLSDRAKPFEPLPIATLYLSFAEPHLKLDVMRQLQDWGPNAGPGQWVFARARILATAMQGCELAVVISHPDALPNADTLTQQVLIQLRNQGLPQLPEPVARRLIVEKRATFAATVQLPRPRHDTPWPRIMLAGDYTDTGYPSVLEGAVRSGFIAARALSERFCN